MTTLLRLGFTLGVLLMLSSIGVLYVSFWIDVSTSMEYTALMNAGVGYALAAAGFILGLN